MEELLCIGWGAKLQTADENKEGYVDKNALKAKYLPDVSFSNNDYVLNALLNLLPKKIHLME